MTTKWMLRVTGTMQYMTYGPYGQKRAEDLATRLNAHFLKTQQERTAIASPMWDPGINELRSQYQ